MLSYRFSREATGRSYKSKNNTKIFSVEDQILNCCPTLINIAYIILDCLNSLDSDKIYLIKK